MSDFGPLSGEERKSTFGVIRSDGDDPKADPAAGRLGLIVVILAFRNRLKRRSSEATGFYMRFAGDTTVRWRLGQQVVECTGSEHTARTCVSSAPFSLFRRTGTRRFRCRKKSGKGLCGYGLRQEQFGTTLQNW